MFIRPSKLAALAGALVICAGAAGAVAACGTGEVGTNDEADSGASGDPGDTTDATTSNDAAPVDAAEALEAAAEAGCAMTLQDELDAGLSVTQNCAACYESTCSGVIAMCNESCTCTNALSEALQCVALGGTEQACLGVVLPILGASTILQLSECSGVCKSACRTDAGTGPSDAAAAGDDADASAADAAIGDAGTDAHADADADAAH